MICSLSSEKNEGSTHCLPHKNSVWGAEVEVRRRGRIGHTSLLKLETGKLFALVNSMREELDGRNSGLETADRTHLGEGGPLVSSAKKRGAPQNP